MVGLSKKKRGRELRYRQQCGDGNGGRRWVEVEEGKEGIHGAENVFLKYIKKIRSIDQ